MIDFVRGNILSYDADYFVIPVACDGVTKFGLAAQWESQDTSGLVEYYKTMCMKGDITPGTVIHAYQSSFILAVVRERWYTRSDYPWIDSIAYDLHGLCFNNQAVTNSRLLYGKHVALPTLGRFGVSKKESRDVLENHLLQTPTYFKVFR